MKFAYNWPSTVREVVGNCGLMDRRTTDNRACLYYKLQRNGLGEVAINFFY